jgi:DNA-binding response OmpR family regulator
VGHKPVVTIIHDDVNRQIILGTLLQLRGFDVRTAPSVRQARHDGNLKDSAVVVVSCDSHDLPALRGLEQPTAGTNTAADERAPRVLALFDAVTTRRRHLAQRLGVDAVLPEPVAPDLLMNTVEHLAFARGPWDRGTWPHTEGLPDTQPAA